MTLLPLTDAEYADFAQRQVVEYARQHIRSGDWPEKDALALSRAAAKDLLADTFRRSGHEFLKGVDEVGKIVGWLWFAPAPAFVPEPRERKRWLSQITVDELRRGQGVGKRLLEALHERLRREAVEELWLRVFDWNEAARRLYESAGYELVRKFPTDAHLRKRLL